MDFQVTPGSSFPRSIKITQASKKPYIRTSFPKDLFTVSKEVRYANRLLQETSVDNLAKVRGIVDGIYPVLAKHFNRFIGTSFFNSLDLRVRNLSEMLKSSQYQVLDERGFISMAIGHLEDLSRSSPLGVVSAESQQSHQNIENFLDEFTWEETSQITESGKVVPSFRLQDFVETEMPRLTSVDIVSGCDEMKSPETEMEVNVMQILERVIRDMKRTSKLPRISEYPNIPHLHVLLGAAHVELYSEAKAVYDKFSCEGDDNISLIEKLKSQSERQQRLALVNRMLNNYERSLQHFQVAYPQNEFRQAKLNISQIRAVQARLAL